MGTIFENAVNLALNYEHDENDFRFLPLGKHLLGGRAMLERYVRYGEVPRLIKEGLIKTFPIELAKKHFVNFFKIPEKQFHISEENGVKFASVVIHNVAENVRMIEKGMQLYGYYLSSINERKDIDEDAIEMIFEPKFQEDCTEELKGQKYFYHVTPTFNVDKIMRIGLCPKNNGLKAYFPERVYIMSQNIIKLELCMLADDMKKHDPRKYNNGKYSILTIDTSKLPKGISFKRDGNTDRGYWTYDNIPPSCIVNVENFDLTKQISLK